MFQRHVSAEKAVKTVQCARELIIWLSSPASHYSSFQSVQLDRCTDGTWSTTQAVFKLTSQHKSEEDFQAAETRPCFLFPVRFMRATNDYMMSFQSSPPAMKPMAPNIFIYFSFLFQETVSGKNKV